MDKQNKQDKKDFKNSLKRILLLLLLLLIIFIVVLICIKSCANSNNNEDEEIVQNDDEYIQKGNALYNKLVLLSNNEYQSVKQSETYIEDDIDDYYTIDKIYSLDYDLQSQNISYTAINKTNNRIMITTIDVNKSSINEMLDYIYLDSSNNQTLSISANYYDININFDNQSSSKKVTYQYVNPKYSGLSITFLDEDTIYSLTNYKYESSSLEINYQNSLKTYSKQENKIAYYLLKIICD